MTFLIPFVLLLLSLFSHCECSGFERRCRCVCPHELEGVTDNQTVFQREVKDADECKCLTILADIANEKVCLQCDCQYESRNTVLIKMVVYGLLAVIFLMTIYAFIIYPIIYVKWIRNSEVNNGHSDENSPSFEARLKRFQRRFQRRVQEQRERYR
ncbi:proton-transporting V-type ATPase complex assembly regulator TMEM9-like [Dysidea avara]|uniref:proton-transporting V-type ATPase complex assembly regulator TMEM9-like n=1 Tax=Dysidea avara TaxID=196820 RepID=UPI00331A0708